MFPFGILTGNQSPPPRPGSSLLDGDDEGRISEHRATAVACDVILVGPPAVGKTHLVIALGVAATDAGCRTYFTSAADMAALQAAHLEGTDS